MSEAIISQAWEDVADDVTGAIERSVQPLLKKAVDDIYGGLLDATQDYLRDNLAFNIASRIDTAERQALSDRQELAREKEKVRALIEALEGLLELGMSGSKQLTARQNAETTISLARGEQA